MCSNPFEDGREVWQKSDTKSAITTLLLKFNTDNFQCRGSHYIALVVLWHIICNKQLRSK